MPKLTVRLYQDTKRPIVGGLVFLFEGGGGIEFPINADFRGVTNLNGEAVFDVYGFFRVGIIVLGRYAADPNMEPGKMKYTWSAWGATGVSWDTTYDIPLKWKLIR